MSSKTPFRDALVRRETEKKRGLEAKRLMGPAEETRVADWAIDVVQREKRLGYAHSKQATLPYLSRRELWLELVPLGDFHSVLSEVLTIKAR